MIFTQFGPFASHLLGQKLRPEAPTTPPRLMDGFQKILGRSAGHGSISYWFILYFVLNMYIYIITFWICVSTLNVFKRGPFSKHVGIVSTLDVTIVQKNQPAIVSYMVELVHGSENLSNSFHNWCFCSKNLEHAHDFEQLFEQLEQFSANCHKWYISKHVLSIWTYSLKMFRLRAIVPTARWEPTKLEACYPKTMYGKEMMGTHFVCKTWEIFMQPGI